MGDMVCLRPEFSVKKTDVYNGINRDNTYKRNLPSHSVPCTFSRAAHDVATWKNLCIPHSVRRLAYLQLGQQAGTELQELFIKL